MLAMLEAERSAAEAVGAWRYLLDADKAGTAEIAVGLQITDTEEELTVHLRNSVLHVTDGLGDSLDAVVALPSSAIAAIDPSQAQTVQGDTDAFARLVGYLDT